MRSIQHIHDNCPRRRKPSFARGIAIAKADAILKDVYREPMIKAMTAHHPLLSMMLPAPSTTNITMQVTTNVATGTNMYTPIWVNPPR